VAPAVAVLFPSPPQPAANKQSVEANAALRINMCIVCLLFVKFLSLAVLHISIDGPGAAGQRGGRSCKQRITRLSGGPQMQIE
jgi:hypothetical protein